MDKTFRTRSTSELSKKTDELRERAALFQLLADGTDEAVVIHDLKSIIAANSSFYRLFGGDPQELDGKTPFSFIAASHREPLEEAARIGADTAAESYGVRLDGTTFPIALSGRSIQYKGATARIVRVHDLTRQKQAEAILKESEERFRVTFEQAGVGMAHVAIDGSWLRVNQSLCEMVGYTREELLKLHFKEITHPDDLELDFKNFNEVLAGVKQHYEIEKRFFHKDGEVVWVNLSVSLLTMGTQQTRYFVSVIEDITARKKMEDTLRQSQKMDVIGQLTSSIAHDFGNFLNVIKGNLELIQLCQSDPKLLEYGNSALAGTELAENLILQLLSLSRNQKPSLEPININELIHSIEQLLRRAVNDQIDLRIELEDMSMVTLGEGGQLETALLNLVLNAGNAMPAGGVITIRTSVATPSAVAAMNANALSSKTYCLIQVIDNGCGMPPHILARACDPFFTTKAAGKGTGLGLSQVSRCVDQMSGFLRLESEEGVGTTVSLFIPCE
jgi:PAS domain S-box-containing protein